MIINLLSVQLDLLHHAAKQEELNKNIGSRIGCHRVSRLRGAQPGKPGCVEDSPGGGTAKAHPVRPTTRKQFLAKMLIIKQS